MRKIFKMTLTRRLWCAMAALSFVALRADDGTVVKDVSPDKRYEVRKSGDDKDKINIADLRERKDGRLLRWEKGGTLVLEEFRIYKGGQWETTYRKIVVHVPEKGPLTIKEVKRIEDSQKPEEPNG